VETVLLAKRNSRSTFPTARITSGIRSGPIHYQSDCKNQYYFKRVQASMTVRSARRSTKGLPFDPENSARLLHVSQSYAARGENFRSGRLSDFRHLDHHLIRCGRSGCERRRNVSGSGGR